MFVQSASQTFLRKPGALYDAWIQNFSLTEIEDLSPGSGTLATAAMRNEVRYTGYVWSTPHATWLGNVLDREAAKMIMDQNSVLWHESLAEALGQFFADDLAEKEE